MLTIITDRAALEVFKKKKLLWAYWDSNSRLCSP